MDIDGFLGPKPVVVDLRARNPQEAITELIAHLVIAQKILPKHKDAIAAAIHQRESAGSTAIGSGIALPHASTELVADVVSVLGRSRSGIRFDPMDGKPVHVVLLFLAPARQPHKYGDFLVKIAKLLPADDFRDGQWRHFF